MPFLGAALGARGWYLFWVPRPIPNTVLHFGVYRFRGQIWYPKRGPQKIEIPVFRYDHQQILNCVTLRRLA